MHPNHFVLSWLAVGVGQDSKSDKSWQSVGGLCKFVCKLSDFKEREQKQNKKREVILLCRAKVK